MESKQLLSDGSPRHSSPIQPTSSKPGSESITHSPPAGDVREAVETKSSLPTEHGRPEKDSRGPDRNPSASSNNHNSLGMKHDMTDDLEVDTQAVGSDPTVRPRGLHSASGRGGPREDGGSNILLGRTGTTNSNPPKLGLTPDSGPHASGNEAYADGREGAIPDDYPTSPSHTRGNSISPLDKAKHPLHSEGHSESLLTPKPENQEGMPNPLQVENETVRGEQELFDDDGGVDSSAESMPERNETCGEVMKEPHQEADKHAEQLSTKPEGSAMEASRSKQQSANSEALSAPHGKSPEPLAPHGSLLEPAKTTQNKRRSRSDAGPRPKRQERKHRGRSEHRPEHTPGRALNPRAQIFQQSEDHIDIRSPCFRRLGAIRQT
ncbi:hypothetical protein GGS20DRAFT_196491 [Poronia punctata]|nr:hypothetical protein GGS20DRAFT_196491 [Poronia punctata]